MRQKARRIEEGERVHAQKCTKPCSAGISASERRSKQGNKLQACATTKAECSLGSPGSPTADGGSLTTGNAAVWSAPPANDNHL